MFSWVLLTAVGLPDSVPLKCLNKQPVLPHKGALPYEAVAASPQLLETTGGRLVRPDIRSLWTRSTAAGFSVGRWRRGAFQRTTLGRSLDTSPDPSPRVSGTSQPERSLS